MPRKPKYINPDQTIEDFYASVSDSYHHPAAGEETGNPARKKQELLAEELLDGNSIVTTIMSNMGLYKACDAIGIHTEKTKVGDKYVAENMMANGYVLGGEQSGHIIFGKYATTGDGILTSLMVMMTMLDKKMPLSMLADGIGYDEMLSTQFGDYMKLPPEEKRISRHKPFIDVNKSYKEYIINGFRRN